MPTGMSSPNFVFVLNSAEVLCIKGGTAVRIRRKPEGAEYLDLRFPFTVVSAGAAGRDGTLWFFDALTRTVAVTDEQCDIVRKIKPALPRGRMPFPQSMAAFSDGRFILAGSGSLMLFGPQGELVQELDAGPAGEGLPLSFQVVVSDDERSVFLFDQQNMRIIKYSLYGEADQAAQGGEEDYVFALKALEQGRWYEERLYFGHADKLYAKAYAYLAEAWRKDPLDDHILSVREELLQRRKTVRTLLFAPHAFDLSVTLPANTTSLTPSIPITIRTEGIKKKEKFSVSAYLSGYTPAALRFEGVEIPASAILDIAEFLSAEVFAKAARTGGTETLNVLLCSEETGENAFFSFKVFM